MRSELSNGYGLIEPVDGRDPIDFESGYWHSYATPNAAFLVSQTGYESRLRSMAVARASAMA